MGTCFQINMEDGAGCVIAYCVFGEREEMDKGPFKILAEFGAIYCERDWKCYKERDLCL